MSTLAALYQQLLAAQSPTARRDLALELLDRANSRQYLDECLRVLRAPALAALLDESQRPILRRKCLAWHQDGKRDKAGLLREGVTRLLIQIAHPDDIDIYQLGVETYYLQPVDDVAQNLRSVSLAGIAPIDLPLACIYATRFLSEPHTSVFNGEPAITALKVLERADQRLPIYQFLLEGGERMALAGLGDVTGRALESLGEDFPLRLYRQLMTRYQAIDQPTASMGIINWVLERRAAPLYDALESLIMGTRDIDLRRYGLVMMAAARDDDLRERLLRLAKSARTADLPLFIEALEICQHDERDPVLELLRRRAKG